MNHASRVDPIKAREQRFRMALEAAPIAMLMIDREGRIVFANRQIEGLFGYRCDEMMGRPVEMLVPRHLRKRHAIDRANFQRHPVARRMGAGRDLHGLRKDGTEVPVEIRLIPVQCEDGEFVIVGVVDISTRRQAEQQLQQANAKLQQRLADLEEFSYTISHDLRAPLRHIEGYVQLLKYRIWTKLELEEQEVLDRIALSVSKMDYLIQDILVYNSVGRESLALASVDLDVVVSELLAQYRGYGKARIEIVRPLRRVFGHPSLVSQVVSNLIDNAVKFAPKEREPSIQIKTEWREGWVRLWVCDNGIGIPPELLPKIFNPFVRAPSVSDYPGTGIGLAIVRKAVKRMRGRVGVESELGSGSRFWIDLREG